MTRVLSCSLLWVQSSYITMPRWPTSCFRTTSAEPKQLTNCCWIPQMHSCFYLFVCFTFHWPWSSKDSMNTEKDHSLCRCMVDSLLKWWISKTVGIHLAGVFFHSRFGFHGTMPRKTSLFVSLNTSGVSKLLATAHISVFIRARIYDVTTKSIKDITPL